MFWRWRKYRPAESGQPNGQAAAGGSTPAEDLKIAHAAFGRGEHQHALQHLAWALAAEPNHAAGRALLDQILTTRPDPLTLVTFSHPETPYPIVAVRAYIHAQRGELDEAVSLMAQVYSAVPGVPFLPWVEEWLSSPERMQAVTPERMASLLASLNRKLPDDIDRPGRDAVERLLPRLRQYQAGHPRADLLASMLSILVRKLGRVDEALAMAQVDYAAAPGYHKAVALAGAYREHGDLDAAVAAYRDALQHNPDDIAVRLDIGDLLCSMGQTEAGLAAYQEVLDREPDHPWARPSALYYRHLLEPDGPWGQQLKQYAAAHLDNEHARDLAGRPRPYLDSLPEPPDVLIDLLRQIAAQRLEIKEFKVDVSAIESPSARLAIERYQQEQFGSANLVITVGKVQRPDPRLPRGQVDYLLWRYQGTDPRPAVAPPADDVAAVVAGLAARPYEAGAWSYQGRRLAATLGPDRLDDLLGVMVHPPDRPAAFTIWSWIQRVQVAAAFILAHLDCGWEGSLRRRVLFSLARGPLDWTVAAAVVALAQLAREEPATAPDIAGLYLDLFKALPRAGGIPYLNALLVSSMSLPSAPPELRRQVERALNEMGG